MNNGINVLSLFDGISCGMVALERAGIKVNKYYASEIEPNAIKVSQKNYPDIIQLGDVTKWRDWDIDWNSIDLLIGGSPCQGFSSAGCQLNFNDPRSKLFFEYVNILNHIEQQNPNIKFMLENVKMKPEWADIISQYLGVGYIEINSRYFSAQNRVRWYWANFDISPYTDKGISLKDIVDDEYIHSASKRTRPLPKEKRRSLCLEVSGDNKSYCLLTVNLNNLLTPLPKGRYIDCNINDYPYRKMTPREMERLQTVPEEYVGDITSDAAAKLLGNGWTVDVIAHIFKGLNF